MSVWLRSIALVFDRLRLPHPNPLKAARERPRNAQRPPDLPRIAMTGIWGYTGLPGVRAGAKRRVRPPHLWRIEIASFAFARTGNCIE
ncbi:MAG: hypothetical protein F4246_04895 [Rhodothermaceae bacterium]|nr:hypothetical protein [Rhodothermaceae bacterium]